MFKKFMKFINFETVRDLYFLIYSGLTTNAVHFLLHCEQ